MKNIKIINIIIYIIIIAVNITSAAQAGEKNYEWTISNLSSEKAEALKNIEYYEGQLEGISNSIYQAEIYGDSNSLTQLKEQEKSVKATIKSLKQTVNQLKSDIEYYKNI